VALSNPPWKLVLDWGCCQGTKSLIPLWPTQ
jgi:hypothetical protein